MRDRQSNQFIRLGNPSIESVADVSEGEFTSTSL